MSMFGAVDLSTLASRQGAPAADGGSPGRGKSPAERPATGAAGPAAAIPAPLVVDVDAASLRDVAETSTQVPVVVVLHTARSRSSADLVSRLEALAQEYAGRFQVARVDVDAAP